MGSQSRATILEAEAQDLLEESCEVKLHFARVDTEAA